MRSAGVGALTVMMGLMVGCGSMSQSSGRQLRAGSYSVPVADKRLERFAKFDLHEVEVRRDGDRLTVKYVLPHSLTGSFNAVSFSGVVPSGDGPLKLEGANGRLECPNARDLSDCQAFYKDLRFNEKGLREVLREISKTDIELSAREAIAVAFHAGGEPHGILHVYNYRIDRPDASYQPR